MPVTLQHIADRAKVTKMTVSNILNGRYEPVRSAAMKRAKRIRKIAAELGYRPNTAARAVSLGRFDAAALILAEDQGASHLPPRLLQGIHAALTARNLHLIVAALPDQALTDEGFVPKMLREVLADGLLVNYNARIPARMIELIRDFHVPSIWINSKQDEDCVYPDDRAASIEATRSLLEAGHRRIVYLDCTHEPDRAPDHYSGIDRYEGYADTMQAAGLNPVQFGTPRLRDAQGPGRLIPAIAELLASPDRPSAVLAYSDLEGRATLAAAAVAGLSLPADLALIQFSDVVASDMGYFPATMLLPEIRVGGEAVDMLAEKMADPMNPLPPRAIPFDFDTGQTFGPVKQGG